MLYFSVNRVATRQPSYDLPVALSVYEPLPLGSPTAKSNPSAGAVSALRKLSKTSPRFELALPVEALFGEGEPASCLHPKSKSAALSKMGKVSRLIFIFHLHWPVFIRHCRSSTADIMADEKWQ